MSTTSEKPKTSNLSAPPFKLGDRVVAKEPGTHFKNGVIIPWQRKHDPKCPRVRWASGWGFSHPANVIRPMTPEEMAKLPVPPLYPCDHAQT